MFSGAFGGTDDAVVSVMPISHPAPPRTVPTDELLMRVMSDFDAMPTLRLTPAQATRLWGLDRPVCDAILHTLVEVEFLERDCRGQFVKTPRTAGAISNGVHGELSRNETSPAAAPRPPLRSPTL